MRQRRCGSSWEQLGAGGKWDRWQKSKRRAMRLVSQARQENWTTNLPPDHRLQTQLPPDFAARFGAGPPAALLRNWGLAGAPAAWRRRRGRCASSTLHSHESPSQNCFVARAWFMPAWSRPHRARVLASDHCWPAWDGANATAICALVHAFGSHDRRIPRLKEGRRGKFSEHLATSLLLIRICSCGSRSRSLGTLASRYV